MSYKETCSRCYITRDYFGACCAKCGGCSDACCSCPSKEAVKGYDSAEQAVILAVFTQMLREVTSDGGRKRAAGKKPPWWFDKEHLPAIFSHLNKYFHGELVDGDSGAHPFVHLAWRALAIAYQDTYGKIDPRLTLCP